MAVWRYDLHEGAAMRRIKSFPSLYPPDINAVHHHTQSPDDAQSVSSVVCGKLHAKGWYWEQVLMMFIKCNRPDRIVVTALMVAMLLAVGMALAEGLNRGRYSCCRHHRSRSTRYSAQEAHADVLTNLAGNGSGGGHCPFPLRPNAHHRGKCCPSQALPYI